MKVLVTGATGQVGGAVARLLLQRGHGVRALASAIAQASGRAVRYQEQALQQAQDATDDMAQMYAWFREGGFTVDIPALRDRFNRIELTPFATWAKRVDWDTLLASTEE